MSPFELVPEQTFAANVARLARERLSGVLAAAADHESHDQPETVHASRKELKRLRALLRLARAGLGDETFRRENTALRDAGRELSATRDAQVLVTAFDALAEKRLHGVVAPGTLHAVRGWLDGRVKTAVAELRTHDHIPRAVALLSAARERIDAWRWQGPEDAWEVPGTGLRKVCRAARRAMRRAARGEGEDDFHEWRKQVKHLGAHVALLRPLAESQSEKAARKLGKLADRLGDEHDLAVLAATLAQAGDEIIPLEERAEIARAIDERREKLRAKALRRGRRFFRERAGEFARRWGGHWEAWRGVQPR